MFEHTRQGAVDVIRGQAPLNTESVNEASELLEKCINQGQPRVLFDLEHVPLIDSAGLELLLYALDHCEQRGGTLKLVAPNHLCHDILAITGIAEEFEIFDDAVSAAGSFAQ